MAGMKFEYDENGAKFFYFIVSFYAMVIVPCTYWFWPRKQTKKELHAEDLSCFEACRVKNKILNKDEPRKKFMNKIIKLILIIGWIGFFICAYKTSQIEIEHKEYDPYAIMGLDREADVKVIKKKYRDLSRTMHPDKGGDESEFKELTKAYKALTDDEARENWAKYGNPDGPGVTQFGIALPKWIVDGKNSYLVLGAYVLVFMIIMPTMVGVWWYRSIKFTGDQLLMSTARVYYHFVFKTPEIIMKRAILILSSSFEFDKNSNSEIIERPSHNTEIPMLFKQVPDMQEKIKEPPFNYIHSIRARAFIYAHLSRLSLNQDTLLIDKNAVIRKCPFLINEMVSIISTVALNVNNSERSMFAPRLDTLENFIRLSQMIVQALWDKKNLLQLPHLEENHLRHFSTKKRNIGNIRQFVTTKDADRRSILRHLTDEQYDDVMRVCKTYPLVTMHARTNVFDDEDEHTITEGALVTMVVRLKRESLETLFDKEDETEKQEQQLEEKEEKDDERDDEQKEQKNQKTVGSRSWNDKIKTKSKSKNNKKKAQKSKSMTNKAQQLKQQEKKGEEKNSGSDDSENSDDDSDEEGNNSQDFEKLDQADLENEREEEKSHLRKRKTGKSAEVENVGPNTTTKSSDDNETDGGSGQNEDFFEKFQKIQKKKEKLVTKSKISHRVFCPHFPEIKQECWWVYVSDKKHQKIISQVLYICNLVDDDEVEIKFLAPKKAGTYTYQVNLKSDSYLDFDVTQNVKLVVQPAVHIEEHPQWNFTDEEADGSQGDENDDFATESEEEE